MRSEAGYDFVQFLLLLSVALRPIKKDVFHLGLEQTVTQDALSDHSHGP